MDDPNSPNRCQAITRMGQCKARRVEGGKYCAVHSSRKDNSEMNSYLITNTEIADLAGHYSQMEQLKSLRDEIALLRALATKRLNMIESNADFLKACGQVNTFMLTLDRLVNSCYRLEVHLGNLLSKDAVLELAQKIALILQEELKRVPGYEDIVDRINEKIIETINKQEQK